MLHDKATTFPAPRKVLWLARGGGGRRGWRQTPGPSESPWCLSRGGKAAFSHGNVGSLQRQRVKEAAGSPPERGCTGAGSGMFCWRRLSVWFLIPPHRLKERARNFIINRTCSVYRRTCAWLLRSRSFPERGRSELPWDLNHHQAFQFLIWQHSTLWLQKQLLRLAHQ